MENETISKEKCPICNSELESWDDVTPFYKIPCIYFLCSKCGAVPYPKIKGTNKLISDEGLGHGILSFGDNGKVFSEELLVSSKKRESKKQFNKRKELALISVSDDLINELVKFNKPPKGWLKFQKKLIKQRNEKLKYL